MPNERPQPNVKQRLCALRFMLAQVHREALAIHSIMHDRHDDAEIVGLGVCNPIDDVVGTLDVLLIGADLTTYQTPLDDAAQSLFDEAQHAMQQAEEMEPLRHDDVLQYCALMHAIAEEAIERRNNCLESMIGDPTDLTAEGEVL